MSKSSSNLLFLAVGAAVGAAICYVSTSERKEEWIKEVNDLIDKVKGNVKDAVCKVKNEVTEDAE